MARGSGGMKADILGVAFIAFTLLGILFGMNIMTFIFGGLDPTTSGLVNGSTAQNTSIAVQENSLTAIQTYSAGANNQFSTLSTIIILLLLITIFAVFWKFFTGGVMKSAGSSGGGNFG